MLMRSFVLAALAALASASPISVPSNAKEDANGGTPVVEQSISSDLFRRCTAVVSQDHMNSFSNGSSSSVDSTVSEFDSRAQLTCSNDGLAQRDIGDCRVSQSKGIRSAHNCPGKYYLCVTRMTSCDCRGVCTTRPVVNCKKVGSFATAEGGECFL
jgi:hypothetical protein